MKAVVRAIAPIVLCCSTSVHAAPADDGAAPTLFRVVVDADGRELRFPLLGESETPLTIPLRTDRVENGLELLCPSALVLSALVLGLYIAGAPAAVGRHESPSTLDAY